MSKYSFYLACIINLLLTDFSGLANTLFLLACLIDTADFLITIDTIMVFVSIIAAINMSLVFAPNNPFVSTILLNKASDFIKGLKGLPEQEAIDKIRAELDETMARPITPESEKYMDSLNDELEKRTS